MPTGAEATRGSLRVSLHGEAVWHGIDEADGFDWTWIELLEFLAESWLYLAVEDGLPSGIDPDTVPRMLAAAEAAIESGDRSESDLKRDRFEAYRTTHDLSEAVQGALMPPLWVVRDGDSGWIASTTATARIPCGELLDIWIRVGDWIAKRLAGVPGDRSRSAVQAWHSRKDNHRPETVESTTGSTHERTTRVSPVRTLRA